MPEMIRDGTGKGYLVKITSDNRITTDSIIELVSAERCRENKLFVLGTGNITPTGSFSLGSVLWFRNDSKVDDIYIQKIIFGWNGGSTNYNRTIFSLIHYNVSAPSANNTEIDDQTENISFSGSSSSIKSANILAYKWNGTGTGMTSGSGGFAQIPNRISQGNTSIPIDGEIILGPDNSMEFRVTPEETGEFHVSVIYYFAPAGKGRSFI